MFTDLDDPEGFEPSDRFRGEVVRAGRRLRRRRRLTRAGIGVVVVVLAVGVTAAAYVDRKVGKIQRVEVAGLAPDPVGSTEPYTALLVGTDGLANLDADDPIRDGRDGVPLIGRADAVTVVQVEPAEDRITVLPIPRDLWLDIPGAGSMKVSATLAGPDGGPSRLVDAVSALLGTEINHYIEVDLGGSMAIADVLGGLRLSLPAPVRDFNTGLALDAGCQTLDGRQLLAFGRARHLQYQGDDGRWINDPTSDFGRMERQQVVAAAALRSVGDLGPSDPLQVNRFVDLVLGNVTIDSGTTPEDLANILTDVTEASVVQRRIPVADAVKDGQNVLVTDADAGRILDGQDPGSTPGDVAGGLGTPPGVLPALC